MLTRDKPHCQPFRDLLAHRKVISYLDAFLGRGWKMDHSPFVLTGGKGTEGLRIHGSTSHHFHGAQYLQQRDDPVRYDCLPVSACRRE